MIDASTRRMVCVLAVLCMGGAAYKGKVIISVQGNKVVWHERSLEKDEGADGTLVINSGDRVLIDMQNADVEELKSGMTFSIREDNGVDGQPMKRVFAFSPYVLGEITDVKRDTLALNVESQIVRFRLDPDVIVFLPLPDNVAWTSSNTGTVADLQRGMTVRVVEHDKVARKVFVLPRRPTTRSATLPTTQPN